MIKQIKDKRRAGLIDLNLSLKWIEKDEALLLIFLNCVESVSWNLAKRRNGTCWTTESRPARVGARQGRGEGLLPKAGDANVEPFPLLCRVMAVQRDPYAQREHGGNSHYWALSNFAWQEQGGWEGRLRTRRLQRLGRPGQWGQWWTYATPQPLLQEANRPFPSGEKQGLWFFGIAVVSS